MIANNCETSLPINGEPNSKRFSLTSNLRKIGTRKPSTPDWAITSVNLSLPIYNRFTSRRINRSTTSCRATDSSRVLKDWRKSLFNSPKTLAPTTITATESPLCRRRKRIPSMVHPITIAVRWNLPLTKSSLLRNNLILLTSTQRLMKTKMNLITSWRRAKTAAHLSWKRKIRRRPSRT